MRKVYKKRDEDAVSPVIATILMVAITVVLAAVLYVMVIGFGSGGSSTPAGAWTNVEATGSTTGKLTFGAFTEDVGPLDLKIFISHNGTADGEISFSGALGAQTTAMTWTPAVSTGATASYFDYNYQGNLINSGDYITLTGLDNGCTYVIEVFHVDTEATVSMTGDSGTFSTPV